MMKYTFTMPLREWVRLVAKKTYNEDHSPSRKNFECFKVENKITKVASDSHELNTVDITFETEEDAFMFMMTIGTQ